MHKLLFKIATVIYIFFCGSAFIYAADQETEIPAKKTNSSKASKLVCPEFLNVEYRKLHSTDMVNLCSLYTGEPILFVNTASHCGFTPQFKALEALYQRYKDQGFQIIGFSSNDFNQAAKTEEKAAGICYKNYGVTFTMLAPTNVKGEKANLTFKYLNSKTVEPQWNFNKYLVGLNTDQIKHYGSKILPLDSELEKEVKKLIF